MPKNEMGEPESRVRVIGASTVRGGAVGNVLSYETTRKDFGMSEENTSETRWPPTLLHLDDRTISAYLAEPTTGSGPGVLVLHAWWGLTEPFRQVCDRLAEAGFVALAPDLYHGKTTASVEEAETLVEALDEDAERWHGDIAAAVQVLRQHAATNVTDGRGKLAFIGFSLGGAYALDMSVNLAEEIAAVVTFYASYPGLNYSRASAAYLCHFAEDDPFEPAESIAEMEQELKAAGKQATIYTYPGTKHWFFEENRPEYDADAARIAWERTIEFLHQRLD